MRFVTVRDFRTHPAAIWKKLPEEQVVITNNGKPIALLLPVSDSDLEETVKVLRRVRAQQALATLQLQAVQDGRSTMKPEEIDAEIQAVRKGQ